MAFTMPQSLLGFGTLPLRITLIDPGDDLMAVRTSQPSPGRTKDFGELAYEITPTGCAQGGDYSMA